MAKERVSSVGLFQFLAPQILRLLEEYEKKPNAGTTEHHYNYKQLQLDYKGDILKFKSSWMCCLCPFLDSTPAETLCYADNGRPLPNNKVLVESVDDMLPLGQQQSLDYTHNRLVLCKTPIMHSTYFKEQFHIYKEGCTLY